MNYWLILLLALPLVLGSCKDSGFKSEAEFFRWLNRKENGLSVTREVNGFRLNVKFLPPEYVAYTTLKNKTAYTRQEADSLTDLYSKSRTFLLTIAPVNENKASGDIMYEQVSNYQEYQERANTMNFRMGDYITLNTGKGVIKPALSTLENIYSLGNQRTIYLVFQEDAVKSLFTSKTLDFTYEDEIFETGISHFLFEKSDLDKVPTIHFWKY